MADNSTIALTTGRYIGFPYVTIKARHDRVAGWKDRCRRTESIDGKSPERVEQTDGTESYQNAADKPEGREA